jgi:hypothetical protein
MPLRVSVAGYLDECELWYTPKTQADEQLLEHDSKPLLFVSDSGDVVLSKEAGVACLEFEDADSTQQTLSVEWSIMETATKAGEACEWEDVSKAAVQVLVEKGEDLQLQRIRELGTRTHRVLPIYEKLQFQGSRLPTEENPWHRQASGAFMPIAAKIGIQSTTAPASNPWCHTAPDDFVPICHTAPDDFVPIAAHTNPWCHTAPDDFVPIAANTNPWCHAAPDDFVPIAAHTNPWCHTAPDDFVPIAAHMDVGSRECGPNLVGLTGSPTSCLA